MNGYWSNYWPTDYWVEDYWPEFGTDVAQTTHNTGWYEYDQRKYRKKNEEDALAFDKRITDDITATYRRIHGVESEVVEAIVRQEVKAKVVITPEPIHDLTPILRQIETIGVKIKIAQRLAKLERERIEEDEMNLVMMFL